MIAFFFLLICSALLFQPIMILVGGLLRFAFRPPARHPGFDLPADQPTAKMLADRYQTLDHTRLENNGDAAKFVGMFSWATGTEQAWEKVTRLFDGVVGTFLRRATPAVRWSDEVTFSGDMLAGIMGAIATRLTTHGLTDKERATLTTIWDNCSWRGLPMVIGHPVHGKSFSRGAIWRPWACWSTGSLLTLLVWLRLGWFITGQHRYQVCYWLTRILHAPALALATGDGQMFLGRVYGIATHVMHSHMLVAATGAMLGMNEGKAALQEMFLRYRTVNLDIMALWYRYGEASQVDMKSFQRLLASTYHKGSKAPIPQNTRYLSLIWPPALRVHADQLYPPIWTGADYSGERSWLKGGPISEEERQAWSLDVIFPAALVSGMP